jgi:hypothetical protein
MSVLQVIESNPHPMAQLFECGTDESRDWQPEELREILRQLWSEPLQFDLHPSSREAAKTLGSPTPMGRSVVETYGDLLRHAAPPLEILRLVKSFAKASYEHPDSPMPRPIALLLYFLSITLALVRCDCRITCLDDCVLRRGLRWYASQRWVDETVRNLFQEGLKQVVCEGRPDCCQPPA